MKPKKEKRVAASRTKPAMQPSKSKDKVKTPPTLAKPAAAKTTAPGKLAVAKAPEKSTPLKAKGAAKEAKAPKKEKKGKLCTEPGCTQPQLTDQYCRLHYIKNWSQIITGRRAQARANLNKYIESLSEKYPDEYMDKIRDDLGSEGGFHARLRELGFREELETTASDNPFQMENLDDFVHGLKFDE